MLKRSEVGRRHDLGLDLDQFDQSFSLRQLSYVVSGPQ